MGEFVFRLPDVGEGLAEAELVQWNVGVGDAVTEDDIIAAVMTDKATVDIPSPVTGKVLWLGGQVGDVLAIGADFIRYEVQGDGNSADVAAQSGAPPLAPPKRAEPAPVAQDLRRVGGSGPAGVISHDDLDRFVDNAGSAPDASSVGAANTSVNQVKIVGLRRKIAEKMVLAKTSIPHITYVEEVDMTKLEELRDTMNEGRGDDRPRLTILPFLMRAIVRAVGEHPQVNATFDDEAGVVNQYGGVHIGIAAQTDDGLVVPVIKHAETMDIWRSADELIRLSDGARSQSLTRDELGGSTITITSLGPMGGIVTTPVINHPEVAIVGVNKMMTRPMWDGAQFVPRKMMNISASFDHRIIDGWVAATFIQKLKTLLETPAMIFIEG